MGIHTSSRHFFLAAALGLMAAGGAQAATPKPLQGLWSASQPVSVRQPFMNDSINPQGTAFSASQLLKSAIRHSIGDQGSVELMPDSTGTVTLQLPAGVNSLQVMSSRLRAERFAKGQLKVTSPLAFKVTLDGADLITKESVERDSITPASTAGGALRLEPEHDVLLQVKLLAMASDSVEAPTVKIVFEPDEKFDSVAVHSGADMLRRFALDDTEFGPRVTGVSMSPDGRWLITKYYNYHSRERWHSYSTLTDLSTGRVVNGNLYWDIHWMPKGNELYYTVKAAEGFDLVKVNPANGAETIAATGLPTGSFTWSPDESYIIYSDSDEGVKEQGPLRRYATPDDRQPGNRHRSFLMKYTPATGLSERLTYGNHSTWLLDISPDSQRLLLSTSRETPTVRPFYQNTIYELDLATLTADTLVAPGPQFVTRGYYSPGGANILFVGSPAAFDGIGNASAPHPIPNDFDNQLFLMDRQSRHVTPLTPGFDPSVKSVNCWNEADGCIYFIGEDGFYNRIYSLNPSTGHIRALPCEVDNVQSMSMGREASRRLAYVGQGYEYAGRAYLLDLKRGVNTLLADPRAERLAEIQLGRVEPWQFTAADSTVVDGVICYPPDFDPSRKYPLIVYYYGGTSPTQRSITQPYTPQLFASRDYVVYVLNPSGTTGYGQEYSARHVNAWGRRTADEIIQGVKAFTEAHPFVDATKVGCLGASYGGFMTQYLQTLTDIFAAAVSHAGISNVTSYWGEGYWGYSYNAVAAADSYPWSDPDLYTRQGSLFNADKINTPLLLLHGTADTNVPIGESIQLFNALRILGKDVEFVSVDGENHFISDYPKRIQWQNTIMAWFARWLQDDPSWWNDLYPDRNL